ncbi:mannose-1-phosphate guanylyltransferase [Roseofilum casamattae]|uniref:Mannose-1-phosphate guanylyltransferase n=1 Tax=Roseofilum casamattae BLCC-M143 TaxID=3022442 RepID=A0ABT7BV90_9CYAN|nr:mannose-1-phosphate guanylyltransferase [Roseofilum casamattae]MDJ1182198.1 mannose-1-phosphate guanylyltransferase [Roseofilum casamattae BLCC-M143]
MADPIIPVILAGGKGERFWPLSRKQRPKQFLSLDGTGSTLLQTTAERLVALAGGWDKVWVCTSRQLASGVREQLPQLPEANILAEPEGRDTAPAVAWTTLKVAERYGEDAPIGFFPADHWIGDRPAFEQTIRAAVELATKEEAIVTLGVKPAYPSTGYGYIEQGEAQGNYLNLPVYQVQRFTEKPDRTTAEQFIARGCFSWNSGMFIFRAGVVLSELKAYAPEILNPLQEQGENAYSELPKISIDYALMEKTQLAYVLPADFGWDDLGDWNAMARLLQGEQTNLELGNHVGLDTQGAIVYDEDPEGVVVTIGLEDVVIVRDGKATLIVKKERTQEIKKVLGILKSDPQYQHLL